jgi:hypothetical protein
VDTSCLNEGDKKTTNYNKRTQEDAIPEIYIRKVQKISCQRGNVAPKYGVRMLRGSI